MDLAIILVSGGMDSCVTAAIASQNYEPAFLHVNYGQRTEKRELRAFNSIADYYRVEDRLTVDVEHLRKIGGSSLTDFNKPVQRADLNRKEIPSTYVPFRNANILAIAVTWGEVIGAKKIFIGAVEEDSSGYPDCRKQFFEAYNLMIRSGTRPDTDLEVVTPIIGLSKSQIIMRGNQLKAPLHLTWSCYFAEDEACGECDSCAIRLRGYQSLGLEDPIPYKKRPKFF